MNRKKVNDLYRKMGIDKQETRRQYQEWNKCNKDEKNEYFFIKCLPSSAEDKEIENA